jgi:carbamoyltransferase
MKVLGINAIFHDPAAALVVDGQIVAAAEEERFSRRKHGKRPVPFSAWELPEQAAAWCLRRAGLKPSDLDAVGYSFDPQLCSPDGVAGDPWDWLRQTYAAKAPDFLATVLPGLAAESVRFVPHHVAHAASAGLAAPVDGNCGVLVLDGRGEAASHLSGYYKDGDLTALSAQSLPHSLGLMYEDLTEHLGFMRSSDEYKVMALASYGKPAHLDLMREAIRTTPDGGFRTDPIDWESLAPRVSGDLTTAHADLASSVQTRLEEVILELARWVYEAAGGPETLVMAGGVALNCVANARIAREGPYRDLWVQPAAGDSGTALGAALHLAHHGADRLEPFPSSGADLGRGFTESEIEDELRRAAVAYHRPASIAAEAARVLAGNGTVAWYQGRSEYGPRALGHRSLLANPADPATTARLNDIKGREQFRPVAPMVLASRAAEIFEGQLPSPYMLFVHNVRPQWRERIPAVVHVDGTARVQTVDEADEPLVAQMLTEFERRTGLPVVVNTSLNTAGRPMVDTPREALELFGSAPVDLLAIGPFAVDRSRMWTG